MDFAREKFVFFSRLKFMTVLFLDGGTDAVVVDRIRNGCNTFRQPNSLSDS